MKSKFIKYLKLFAKFGITILALYYVFNKVDIDKLSELLRQANKLLILVALLAFVLSKLVSAYRLNQFLGKIGIKISESFNLRLYLLGMYYNLFLPGGIGGDGYKIYFLSRKFDVKTKNIFWTILVDRLIGVLALFCLAILFYYTVSLFENFRPFVWVLIPISIAVAYLLLRHFFSHFISLFVKTGLQSVAVQALQVLSALFILYSLNVQENIVGYLFIFLLSSIVAVLPLTVGGIGSREFTFMLGAQWIGLDIDISIALSLIFYLITAFTSLWGIIYSIKPNLLYKADDLITLGKENPMANEKS